MNNKRVLGISVAAVVLLVIAIIATSYAAFTANLTGTKENKLTAGHVLINCAETNFSLENTKALTDAQGISLTGNTATCTLTSQMSGEMTVGYDIALYDVDAATPNDALGINNVKIQVSRSIDNEAATYVAGSSSTGVLVSSLANVGGAYDTAGITSYKLDSNTLEGNHSVLYTIKGWVTSTSSSQTTLTDVCSDESYTTKASCEAANNVWGDGKRVSTGGGSFSFKIKLGATQVLS